MQDYGLIKQLRAFLLKPKEISEKISGIFTVVPADIPYPYVTLALMESTSNTRHAHVTFCLKVWSAYQGLKEIQDLAARIQKILETPKFLLALDQGASVTSLKLSQQRMDMDPRGIHTLSLSYGVRIHLKRKGA
ncbi:MAG: DUF3168 domain-containing protein [Alphaproteobacteria bacterium]